MSLVSGPAEGLSLFPCKLTLSGSHWLGILSGTLARNSSSWLQSLLPFPLILFWIVLCFCVRLQEWARQELCHTWCLGRPWANSAFPARTTFPVLTRLLAPLFPVSSLFWSSVHGRKAGMWSQSQLIHSNLSSDPKIAKYPGVISLSS